MRCTPTGEIIIQHAKNDNVRPYVVELSDGTLVCWKCRKRIPKGEYAGYYMKSDGTKHNDSIWCYGCDSDGGGEDEIACITAWKRYLRLKQLRAKGEM